MYEEGECAVLTTVSSITEGYIRADHFYIRSAQGYVDKFLYKPGFSAGKVLFAYGIDEYHVAKVEGGLEHVTDLMAKSLRQLEEYLKSRKEKLEREGIVKRENQHVT